MFDAWGVEEFVYTLCFFLGFVYALVTALLSGIFTGGAEGLDGSCDHPGGMDGHGDPSTTADHGALDFSPFSPIVIAMFITSFGAAGIISKQLFQLPLYGHLPIGLGTGFLIAGLSYMIFSKLFRSTQGSSEPIMSDIVGSDAEVLTPITETGLGEIAYYIKGTRYTAAAKSATGNKVAAHVIVKIDKVVGNTFHVTPKV